MRPLLVFFLALVFGLPAYADDLPLSTPSSKGAKPAYQGRKDQCLTENVSIEKGKLTVTNNDQSKAYKDCIEKNKQTGCMAAPTTKAGAAACTCGTASHTAFDGVVCGPISKCDLDYKSKIATCGEGSMGKALADAAIRDIASDAVQSIPRDAEGNITDAGRQQLSQVLQSLGATEKEAQKAVQEDPDKTYKLIEELSAGNKEEAQKLADDLNLNPDVLSSIARLEPKDLPHVLDGVMTEDQRNTARAFAQSTGFQASEDPDSPDHEGAAPGQDPDQTMPLALQSANNQIRSTAQTLCQSYGIQDCKQFENNMIATFYQECGGRANCMEHGRSYAGSFALSQEEYANGLRSYLSACDSASDACSYVQQSCSGDARGSHLCNAAAASANHARIEQGVQAATSDPREQAAIHMMYQLMPTQTVQALQSGDPSAIFSLQLNGPSLSALCSNKICFANGATGGDAVNGILRQYGTLRRGVEVATGVADPGLGGLVPSRSGTFPGSDILARNGASPFSQSIPFSNNYAGNSGYTSASYSPARSVAQPAQNISAQPISQALLREGNIQSNTNVSEIVQAVASIIAQPREVTRGDPITVSWSSVGTSKSTPCEVFLRSVTGTSTIARGNEGSERVSTSVATGTFMWGFTLQCTAFSGSQLIQQATSVSIK